MDESLLTEQTKKDVVLGVAPAFPVHIEWQLTYRCNANCVMCDMDCRDKSDELSTQKVFSVIDELKELGTKMIILTGGEPFLRKDIFQIIKYANEKDILVSIHTNGVLIDSKTITKLSELKVHTITISLHYASNKQDSVSGVKGSYEKIVNAISLLKNNFGDETRVNLRCVLTTNNYGGTADFIELYKSTKFDSLKFIFARPLTKTANADLFLDGAQKNLVLKNIKELASTAPFPIGLPKIFFSPKTKCLCSYFRATITPNGNVIPSCYCEDIIMGNVNKDSFHEIWFGKKSEAIRKKVCVGCEQSFNQELNEKLEGWKNE